MTKYQLSDVELYGFLTYGDNTMGQLLQSEVDRHGWDLLAYESKSRFHDDATYGCWAIDPVESVVVGGAEHPVLLEAIAGAILEAEINFYNLILYDKEGECGETVST